MDWGKPNNSPEWAAVTNDDGEAGHSREQDERIGTAALSSESPTEKSSFDPAAAAKQFLRRHRQQLSLFARDSSLRFEQSASAKTFSFNPEEFKINVPLSWFASEKYTEDELDFANHHEIAHFIDMRENPEAYIENFEYMEKRAEELAKAYLAKHPGKATLNAVRKFYYKEIHSLYNKALE